MGRVLNRFLPLPCLSKREPGEKCVALPSIGTTGRGGYSFLWVSMAISGTDVLDVPNMCLQPTF